MPRRILHTALILAGALACTPHSQDDEASPESPPETFEVRDEDAKLTWMFRGFGTFASAMTECTGAGLRVPLFADLESGAPLLAGSRVGELIKQNEALGVWFDEGGGPSELENWAYELESGRTIGWREAEVQQAVVCVKPDA